MSLDTISVFCIKYFSLSFSLSLLHTHSPAQCVHTHYPSMHKLHTETEDDVSLTLLPSEWGTCGWGWGSSGPSSQSGSSPPTPPSPDQAESTSQWRTQEHPYGHLESYGNFNTNTQKHGWIIPDTHVCKIRVLSSRSYFALKPVTPRNLWMKSVKLPLFWLLTCNRVSEAGDLVEDKSEFTSSLKHRHIRA